MRTYKHLINMSKPGVSKSTVLLYALDVYENEGRSIFTTIEVADHTGLATNTVRSELRRLLFRGYVHSYRHALVKCGSMKCRLIDTIWTLTRKGIEYAADCKLDFEPATGQYLLRSESKSGVESSPFTLELD